MRTAKARVTFSMRTVVITTVMSMELMDIRGKRGKL